MELFRKKTAAEPGGNGHDVDLGKLVASVEAQGQALGRVIQHMQSDRPAAAPIASAKERRDLFDTLTDPPDDILPALTNVSPLMATLIPAMNVIKWNYTPRSERPINPKTQRPYGMYLLWETDYARWSLSKNAGNAIRLCEVVQTRGETGKMGIVAE
jgi:hypothetical protein